MPKTFAQYLIDKALPGDMHITRQVDSGYLKELLTEVARRFPDRYAEVVSHLKRLGDRLSTYEPVTMGLEEISVPDKKRRDAVVRRYTRLVEGETDKNKVVALLGELQDELAKTDLDGATDDASTMVRSALQSGKYPLMKLRTSPGVVGDHAGGIVPEIFPKSYAEGVDPLHFWLGATESRKNVAEGQVATAKPGELNKVFSNVLGDAVVTTDDCGTKQGILLGSRDEDILGRCLARAEGGHRANTLITADVQQDLLHKGVERVLVRSPQTCAAAGGAVCRRCMGLRPGTGRPYEIGDNAGLITAGSIGEPLTQMSLSAKHSTSLAKTVEGLRGEKGLRQFVESPKNYPLRKILCEVVGTIFRIRPAPQGGTLITIRQTRPVPDRYIVHALPTPGLKRHVDYHIPPNLKPVEGLKEGAEVWPGMELSTGVDNIQDIARLRNLGLARSAAAQNMYDIYKNTGNKLDRRHFELVARKAHPYVRLEQAPPDLGWSRGEVVDYNQLQAALAKLPTRSVNVNDALGLVLGRGVLDCSAGMTLDGQAVARLRENRVATVDVVDGLEVSAVSVPLTRVVNMSEDWLAALSHRYLKTQLRDAASYGKKSNLHGTNPYAAYAYGVELRHGEGGKY